ncbi:MAG: hypothetical protein ACP5IC_00495 [Minisyncoccia bacterium]
MFNFISIKIKKIKYYLKTIQKLDYKKRKKIFNILTILTMLLIIILWIIYLRNNQLATSFKEASKSFQQYMPQSENQSSYENFWSSFKTGINKISSLFKNGLSIISQNINTFYNDYVTKTNDINITTSTNSTININSSSTMNFATTSFSTSTN